MKFIHIMGRLTALIEDAGHLGEGDVAEWFPCRGEEFDIIFYRPGDPALSQTLNHEFLHAVLDRIGFNQTDIGQNLEEMIVDTLATFIDENYDFKTTLK
jgi:hypothetical protein